MGLLRVPSWSQTNCNPSRLSLLNVGITGVTTISSKFSKLEYAVCFHSERQSRADKRRPIMLPLSPHLIFLSCHLLSRLPGISFSEVTSNTFTGCLRHPFLVPSSRKRQHRHIAGSCGVCSPLSYGDGSVVSHMGRVPSASFQRPTDRPCAYCSTQAL